MLDAVVVGYGCSSNMYGVASKRGARADGLYMAKTYLNDISSDSSQWLMDIN